jgi:CspA family cold shock protein
MKKGTVKFFNSEKGFGFIVPEDGSEDLFVHHTGLIDDINEGEEVEYEVGEGRKGPNAIDVKVVG